MAKFIAGRVLPLREALLLLALLASCAPFARAQNSWGVSKVGADFYFSDLERGRAVRLDARWRLHVLIADIHCHNLASGYDGNVYGESVGTSAGGMGNGVGVWRIANGRVEYPTPLVSPPAPGVWITRDAGGNSYSWHREGETISRIIKRSTDGEVVTLAGGPRGFEDGPADQARFGGVGAIVASRDGTLYVTDSGHLRTISRAGNVTTLLRDFVSERTGGLPGDFGLFNHSVGLAVDERGNVYAVDAYNLRVVRWNHAQGARVIWDGTGWLSRTTNDGLGWRPRGVAVDGDDVYVLAGFASPRLGAELIGSPRILRLRADGSTETVFAVASTPLRIIFAIIAAGLLLLLGRRLRRVRRAPSQSSTGATAPS